MDKWKASEDPDVHMLPGREREGEEERKEARWQEIAQLSTEPCSIEQFKMFIFCNQVGLQFLFRQFNFLKVITLPL